MESYCCTYDDIKSAIEDIRPFIHRTPLMTCTALDNLAGTKLYLKTENFQKTGSFKFRGATNAAIKLQKSSKKPECVVTESSGNHGQAMAKAAQNLGLPCHVVMPAWSVESKVEAIKGYGATVYKVDATQPTREKKVRELVEKYNGAFINPSQDPYIIAGQGTTAVEILEDMPDIDVIVAPVGGGGLVSGVAIAAKSINPSIKVIAAEPEEANDCYISKIKGELTPNPKDPDTVADGVRVNVGPNAWPIIRDLVDDVITVSESDIISAMLTVWERAKLVIEPTTGVGMGAVFSDKFKEIKANKVAVILCGGNVDLNALPDLIARRRNVKAE
uniref:serine racemase-like n=1 Tax=Styela clava TaxID=7725 RepID=UPI00193A0A3D|nr:serine racemase-like [Styela clava]